MHLGHVEDSKTATSQFFEAAIAAVMDNGFTVLFNCRCHGQRLLHRFVNLTTASFKTAALSGLLDSFAFVMDNDI